LPLLVQTEKRQVHTIAHDCRRRNFLPVKEFGGHNVEESFYAQHQLEALNLNNTILDELKLCGSGKTELELRSLLGCFLFSGDEVEKEK